MGELMRAHDWACTPLGDPATWPQSLRSVIGLLLNARFPMFVAWGPVLSFLYNDPYADILGAKHPRALGAAFGEIWSEIWPDISPLVEAAMAGEASYRENLPLLLNRKGFKEQAWFTFSYSPVRDDSGSIAGMFCACTETTGQVRAEQLLRESEARARGVLEGMAEGFVLLDRDFRVIDINSEGARVDQRPRGTIIGKTHWEAWPGSEDGELGPLYRRVMAERRSGNLEHRYVWPDGRIAWMEVRVHPSGDGLALFYREVTGRKQAEMRQLALLTLGDRLRDLADTAEMSFAAAEILGTTLGVSRAGYGTIDLAHETISIERDWSAPGIPSLAGQLRFRDYGTYIEDLKRGDLVVFADAEKDPRTAANAQALQAIDARAVLNMPVTEARGFVALLFLAHAHVHEWTPGEIGFVREVANRTRSAIERRRAELHLQELAASLERQVAERTADRNRLWRLSADIMIVARFDGTITATNPAWTRVLGWTAPELVGRNLFELIHPDDLASSLEAARDVADGSTITRFDNRYRHKDGSYRWITWTAAPGDELINASGRDFTAEREQAEALATAQEALRQSQKMEAVGQLTGGIAHDFNNMLAVVIGSLELLGRRIGGDDARARRYVDAASEGAQRAALLTKRLLAFSRQQPLRPEPVDANKLVGGMSDLLRHSLGADIRLETVLAGGLWRTHSDPNQLENVILNLAVNARDAMPDGGRLTLETQNAHLDARYAAAQVGVPAGQYVLVAVTDTGCGMSPEVIAKAFDPFFTTKEVGRGTGLGLSQVYGFVKQSGGHVNIYSEPGQGTTVKIYLPRLSGASAGTGAVDASRAIPLGERDELVLVVEDEPWVRQFSVDALGELGYPVLEADGAAAALRLLDTHPEIMLLFTDVVMPDMNGRKLADAARARRPDLKVLFTTGYTRDAVVHNGVLDPGVSLIGKPFTIEELATKVREVLEG